MSSSGRQTSHIAYLTIIIKCGLESFHQVTFCVTPESHVPTSLIFSGNVFVCLSNVKVALDAVAAYSRQASRWLHGKWSITYNLSVEVRNESGNAAGGGPRNQTCRSKELPLQSDINAFA